jgi:subtilisin family serine protease
VKCVTSLYLAMIDAVSRSRFGLGALVFVFFVCQFAVAEAATEYVEGDVLVTFKAGADLNAAKAVLSKHSLKFDRHFAWLSQQRDRQMGLVKDQKRKTAQLIEELKKDANVETAEPNYLRWVKGQPNDARFGEMWSLQNTGQTVNGTAGTSGADVDFLPAWNLAQPFAGEIVVGVIDTGADYVHPDLAANIWTNPGETLNNSVDDDGNGYTDDYYGYDFVDGDADPADSGDHGTHVSGTIAAVGNNQYGVIGINSKARIMTLKVSADGNAITSSAEIAAIQYATMMKGRGVNIVALNASYGGGGSTSAESAAIQAAGNAGIIFCAAAGNSSSNNDTAPTYPANYRLSNMIVVAASDQNDALASFSNYGATTVDLAAPGANILSTKPSTVTFQAGGTTYPSAPLAFSGTTTGLSGAIYDCGIGNPEDFPAAVNGNIALIARGTLTFSEKVSNAMAAGARAAIIYNNVGGPLNGTLQTVSNWIPAREISRADGLAIKAALPVTGAIVVTGNFQFLDGTSMATPHVTGAVAFAALNHPGETVAQRRQRILTHVEVKAGLQGKVTTNGRLNLLGIVDPDSNGLPDWWESTYFGQLGGVNPNDDSDSDGRTNLQEFLAGTNPTAASSVLSVSALSRSVDGSAVSVTWEAVPGKTYQVFAGDAPDGPWRSDLPNSLVTALSGQTSVTYTDTTALGVSRRFYRIEVVP